MMTYKALYFVTILSLCPIAQANPLLQDESEKLSSRMIQSAAVIQPENGAKVEIVGTHVSMNENSEQPLRGGRSHLPRAAFRKSLLMITQPVEAISISDSSIDIDIDAGEGEPESTPDPQEDPLDTADAIDFREFFDTPNLFTELSYLPTSMIQLPIKN